MMSLARDERADLAAFLATLEPEQWDAATLCEQWRVRDVVAHLVSYDELDARGLLARFARGRFLPSRVNAVGFDAYRDYRPDQLLALLNEHLTPRGFTAAFGGMIALLDGLIHHQDIRRPLGRPREIPEERLRRALPAALVAPPIGAFWRARGLRLVATDIGWTARKGPELRGPAEALLMAVAGRADALDELTGPGRPILADRMR